MVDLDADEALGPHPSPEWLWIIVHPRLTHLPFALSGPHHLPWKVLANKHGSIRQDDNEQRQVPKCTEGPPIDWRSSSYHHGLLGLRAFPSGHAQTLLDGEVEFYFLASLEVVAFSCPTAICRFLSPPDSAQKTENTAQVAIAGTGPKPYSGKPTTTMFPWVVPFIPPRNHAKFPLGIGHRPSAIGHHTTPPRNRSPPPRSTRPASWWTFLRRR